jgi:hypothetical protein
MKNEDEKKSIDVKDKSWKTYLYPSHLFHSLSPFLSFIFQHEILKKIKNKIMRLGDLILKVHISIFRFVLSS